jgi:PilZ domain
MVRMTRTVYSNSYDDCDLERRGENRYPLSLPAVFSWQDENGKTLGGTGCSRDISLQGVYVQSQVIPAEGTSVEIEIFLPRITNWLRLLEYHAKGRVVRIEKDLSSQQVIGFATMNHTAVLREPHATESGEQDSGRDALDHDGAAGKDKST